MCFGAFRCGHGRKASLLFLKSLPGKLPEFLRDHLVVRFIACSGKYPFKSEEANW